MPQARALSGFSARNSAEIVGDRLSGAGEGPLPGFLVQTVRHLHELVRETRPSRTEWRAMLDFLTEVGHAADDKRQEWVLLSDMLGISALVEDINSERPKGATPNVMRGPFYRADAPRVASGADICLDGRGERLEVAGRVLDLDGRPVPGATVETWQANGEGLFENQQPDLQPDFNLRGVFTTDEAGGFHYVTVKPAGYRVPEDGPVGRLLKRVGFSLERPAHLHFRVGASGFETITTQIFDGADPDLHRDAIFGVKPELVAAFRRPEGGGAWRLEYDFVMVRAKEASRAA